MSTIILSRDAWHFINDSLQDVRAIISVVIAASTSGSDITADAGSAIAVARNRLDDAARTLAAAWEARTAETESESQQEQP